MQQVSASSGLQGSQAQGSVSSQSTRSVGDPPQSSRVTSRPKKRERSVPPVCDAVKHQRTDKGRRCANEKESTLKPEASSLVGKDGGISSVASVDRLVCIMQYEWNDNTERQLDLVVSRTMLSKVVANTAERDCLVKFLKLGGLAILDRWLQEAHRGRHFGIKEISEDAEKAVEDLLFALLGALERLPVDLFALKTCPVGKSVNLLRSHKHLDIQRRSKKLVEIWKKRVESEMKLSGEGRLSVDPPLSVQQQEGGIITSKSQQACFPEHPTFHDNLCVGRGKYASVASLCSSPERQLKAPSTLLAYTAADCSGDIHNKMTLPAHVPAKSYKGGLPDSPLHLPSSLSPRSEDGRAKSSVDAASNMAFAQVSFNQPRAAKGTGATRSRNSSKTPSAAPALSGSVIASKDSSASGSKEHHESAVHTVVTLPCCSSSQKNPQNSLVYDGLSRSSLNSMSSCATDCNQRSTIQPYMCAEPGKTGIQLLANIAASESSMIDIKGSDSPSNKSVSMQRPATIPKESSILTEQGMKYFNQSLVKASGPLPEGEHYDQVSSTVSSPSETSAHVDIRICESKRMITANANSPGPPDNISETSLPYSNARKDVCALASPRVDMHVVNESIKRVCLQPALVAEAVGESSAVDRTETKDRVNATYESALERPPFKGGLQEGSPPQRYYEDDPLEVARQVAVAVQQEVVDSHGRLSRRGSTEQSSFLVEDVANTGRSVLKPQDNLHTTFSETRFIVPSKGDVNERPDFDLNEMFSSEEGPIQVSAISGSPFIVPTQDGFVPSSGPRPSLPVVPMAPIAVVAATKGPFTLPSVSYLPRGGIGWKGSAATSAFRPTQPRHNLQKSNLVVAEKTTNVKVLLDFDLNVAVDSGFGDHDMGLSSSSPATTLPSKQGSNGGNLCGSVFYQKASGPHGAGWDLNQVDEGVVETEARPEFDLNSGPVSQDIDDVVLSGKHHGIWAPLDTDTTNSGSASKLSSHPLNSVAPITMPAFALANSDFAYPMGAATPWLNSGPHDGMFQYNILMQNQPGMTCPPLPPMPAGSYGGIPFGFSPTSMQSFSAPFMDTFRGSHTVPSTSAKGEQPILPSQSKTSPYMMGILADAIHHQGNGGFWSRSNLDLNAGPDGIDSKNIKDDRRHMLAINEHMRARHQVRDMAQQRDQEGCLSIPGSMQGALLKQQPVWQTWS